MTKPYARLVLEQRRLSILRLLAASPGYQANQFVLYEALPSRGAAASARDVAEDLAWLADFDLVTITGIEGVLMARITQYGLDVAKGFTRFDGVQFPGPNG